MLSDPQTWFVWIRVAAFICGLLFGAFAIGSTSWVLLRRQALTIAACWLATLGTAMIGMSIWQSISIEGAGFRASLGQLTDAWIDASQRTDLAAVEHRLGQLTSRAEEVIAVRTTAIDKIVGDVVSGDGTIDRTRLQALLDTTPDSVAFGDYILGAQNAADLHTRLERLSSTSLQDLAASIGA